MNPYVPIISAVIAVVTLVLAIFGASWLGVRNVGLLLNQLGERVDARVEGLVTEVRSEIRRVDQRLKLVEQRLASLEQGSESVEKRLDRIERQLEAVLKPMLPPRTS